MYLRKVKLVPTYSRQTPSMIFSLNNSKATGIDLLFRLTGSRLARVGVVNFIVGLLLTRLTIVGDAAGRRHLGLR